MCGSRVLVTRGSLLQGAVEIVEGGKATGRLETGGPRVLEGVHGVVRMERMACVVERPPRASDESIGESGQRGIHGREWE